MTEASIAYHKSLERVKLALDSLSVYRPLRDDGVLKNLYNLLDYLGRSNREDFQANTFINLYNDLYYSLVSRATGSLRDYIINLILYHESPYSLSIEGGNREMEGLLKKTVAGDLCSLELAAGVTPAVIKQEALKLCQTSPETAAIEALPEWVSEQEAAGNGDSRPGAVAVADLFRSGIPWDECIEALTGFYREHGSGIFARYRAFVWERRGNAGYLKGIANPDPVTLSDLIGYEEERAEVIENTLHFLHGHPANNVLLYGDRGTGKSSTVKALLNEYHGRGLRIIEIPKEYLADFPEVVRALKGRSLKFIIFIDDLAFEDSAESYTALKAVLEGGLESRSRNVLIYATSNRRHLIKERFGDRAGLQNGGDDEVRAHDTLQEKLSLADRFGITVIFPSPDRERYLRIVEGMAAKRGLRVDREYLHTEALKWEKRNNGRSPRTARQFVDWLEGHLAMSLHRNR